jgi:hypothetical protein
LWKEKNIKPIEKMLEKNITKEIISLLEKYENRKNTL